MQTVEWNAGLPVLSQDSHFHVAVKELLNQCRIAELFFPEEYTQPPELDGVHPDLLIRDLSRSSTFRISCFGAEDSKASCDRLYAARDTRQSSKRAERAQVVAQMLFRRSDHQIPPSSARLGTHIWEILKSVGTVTGPLDEEISADDFVYDARWLEGHPGHWASMWCWMHEHAQGPLHDASPRRFRRMMWFATMAFAPEADLDMIHTAAAMFTIPDMHAIRPLSIGQLPPGVAQYSLSEGAVVDREKLQQIIEKSLKPLTLCPEDSLPSLLNENWDQHHARKKRLHQKNQDRAVTQLLDHVATQFPSAVLKPPVGHMKDFQREYMFLDEAMSAMLLCFKTWHDNHLFWKYLLNIQHVVQRQTPGLFNVQKFELGLPIQQPASARSFIGTADLFSKTPRGPVPAQPRIAARDLFPETEMGHLIDEALERFRAIDKRSELDCLIDKMELKAKSLLERQYAEELRQSQEKWTTISSRHQPISHRRLSAPQNLMAVRVMLEKHVSETEKHVRYLLECMTVAVRSSLGDMAFMESLHHCPRLSSVFFLHQLSRNGWEDGEGWCRLPTAWKQWIVAYGVALTELQRANRILFTIQSMGNESDLIRELQNEGHANWDPLEYPESLLIEVESNIMIRDVQEEIAGQMRNPSRNTVMQLNMGEGKSSVIVPIVTVALADTSRLVRVIVAKPQSRQMFRMLVSKLGGLLNRRICHLPFSRALRLTKTHAKDILEMCRLCMETRGVMLVQPEHILSFQLMGLESFISGKESIGRCLLQTQDFFNNNSRDIVDESDENFSVKFELIYTMGLQSLIDFAPERWIVIQTVLGLIREQVVTVKELLPLSIEISGQTKGGFPRIRLLKKDATDMLLSQVARAICTKGFPGFPISRQPRGERDAVLKYITLPALSPAEIAKVETGVFWTDTTKKYVWLLRGLFARGILAFVFGRKRWRVNYGLDPTRRPPTKLAVPYRAKDSPSPRSEFSHPDVIICLTAITYYYHGLDDDNLFLAFGHLVESDQAGDEYQAWVADSHDLAEGFRQLMGINLKDAVQCKDDLFPAFRYAKCTIDYFLEHIVFPRYMKEFPEKLSASGWDLGAVKAHPTTGFSGTIDSKRVLPLDVNYLGLPDQEGTNAQVLEYLLRPENKVVLLPSSPPPTLKARTCEEPVSDAETLLDVVLGQEDPHLRVILDVGAQILELTNAEMATKWLNKAHSKDHSVRAIIYFDDNEELMVLDINGLAETFWTSPYVEQLDLCLVFLDEAHTRGTDLKLPEYYKAAVTLGANLTKDRLVQACMRMRKLGKGQSVVFCIPQEIQTKIREEVFPHDKKPLRALRPRARLPTPQEGPSTRQITVEDVLFWAMSETIRDIGNSVPLWAVQGRRFERQQIHWKTGPKTNSTLMTAEIARNFLEPEAQTVESRYQPRSIPLTETSISHKASNRLEAIHQRCLDYGTTSLGESTLEEEQERELSPEIEEERQVEGPSPAEAATHAVHPDLRTFVASGNLKASSSAFLPAFKALQGTSAAKALETGLELFPQDILVTDDFARTVKLRSTRRFASDSYQRPVQWILTSQPRDWKHVVIISPHEAQELIPQIRTSQNTTLHLYSPRPSQQIKPLDKLDLYTVSASPSERPTPLPLRLRTILNLFAGQLYLSSLPEYIELCKILRLSRQEATDETVIDADGFIRSSTSSAIAAIVESSTFTKSPVRFLKSFLSKVRRDGQSIEKTHLGRILDGALLQLRDFDFQGENEGG